MPSAREQRSAADQKSPLHEIAGEIDGGPKGRHGGESEIVKLRRRVAELETALERARDPVAPSYLKNALGKYLEACPIGIAILSEDDGRRLFANSALVTMLGSGTREDLLHSDLAETWVDRSQLSKAWSQLQQTKILVNFEAERVRRDGSRWWVLMNGQAITFEGRAGVIVWHIDITDRKEAEEARRESESRFREAVESLSDAFALFDPDDRLIFCNRMFRELNPELAANIRPGMTFEDMVRDNIKHGRIVEAQGCEEEFVR